MYHHPICEMGLQRQHVVSSIKHPAIRECYVLRMVACVDKASDTFSGDRAKILRDAENIATEKWRLPTRWHKVNKEL